MMSFFENLMNFSKMNFFITNVLKMSPQFKINIKTFFRDFVYKSIHKEINLVNLTKTREKVCLNF